MEKNPMAFLRISGLVAAGLAYAAAAKIEVPLFLMSGQSNMVGLGASVSDLTADQKKTFENVRIYLDAEGDASRYRPIRSALVGIRMASGRIRCDGQYPRQPI
jgi:hypothetical protein